MSVVASESNEPRDDRLCLEDLRLREDLREERDDLDERRLRLLDVDAFDTGLMILKISSGVTALDLDSCISLEDRMGLKRLLPLLDLDGDRDRDLERERDRFLLGDLDLERERDRDLCKGSNNNNIGESLSESDIY